MNTDKVTLRDIYNAVNDLRKEQTVRFEKIEERMDGFDAFKNRAVAIAGLFSLGASAVFTWVWERITKQSG